MQIVNTPHPSLALFVRRVNGTQAGKYRSWEVACALGGGLAFGRTKKEATDELERAQRFGADRLTSDVLGSRLFTLAREGGSLDEHVSRCARVREDFREGRFTTDEAEALGLVGERATWYQLDEYALDALAREAPSRALVEIRPTTRGVDHALCVGVDDEISSP